jgi:outer membrane receptor protein involved in Fe transport
MLFLFIFFINVSTLNPQEKKIVDEFEMSLEDLLKVNVITAAKSPQQIGDIPASVVIITREEIEKYGYMTLTEILESIPGLYAIDDYCEGGVNFGVRGFWSGVPNNNMIILVNGVSQVDDFSSNYPLDKIAVPVEAIDRIEVIRGPMSVIYGSGAFLGVINIITNDISRGTKSMAVFSAGSQKTKKIFLRCADEVNGFKYVCNASIYDTYGMNQPLSEMVRDVSVLPAFGLMEDDSTGGRLEVKEKHFNFSGSFKNFYTEISHIQTKNEVFFFYPTFSEGSKADLYATNISLGCKKVFSDKFSFDGKVTFSQNRWWETYDFLFDDFYGIQQFESRAWESELELFIKPSPHLGVKTGFYYRSVQDASNMYDIPSFNTTSLENNYFYLADGSNIVTRAFFTQVNCKPFRALNLVAGVRLEQMPRYDLSAILAGGTENFQSVSGTYDRDKIEVIPRFAAIYSLNDNHIFKLLYGQAINRPSFFQNSINLLLQPGKGSLKPEHIRTFELNYIASLTPDFIMNFSLFRNNLKNLITRVSGLDENGDYRTWSSNAGEMVTYGSELTIKIESFDHFRVELSGTYQKTCDKRPGYEEITTAYSPDFLGYIKASYRVKDFTLALTGNYVDSMETYWDETIINPDGSGGNRIGDRVDGYFLLGANVRIDNLHYKGLYVNIRCSNLLNAEIRYPTFTNNAWADRGMLGSGRKFLVSIGLKF